MLHIVYYCSMDIVLINVCKCVERTYMLRWGEWFVFHLFDALRRYINACVQQNVPPRRACSALSVFVAENEGLARICANISMECNDVTLLRYLAALLWMCCLLWSAIQCQPLPSKCGNIFTHQKSQASWALRPLQCWHIHTHTHIHTHLTQHMIILFKFEMVSSDEDTRPLNTCALCDSCT